MLSSAGEPSTAVRGTIVSVTPTTTTPIPNPGVPAQGPTHGCARCGKPVPIDVGLCDDCNPLGLRDVSASQVHGTVVIALLVGFVGLAVIAALSLSGVGPFPAHLDGVTPEGEGVRVTLTVTNEGSAAGQTTCRVQRATNQGGGPNAFVLTPELGAGETRTFSQLVTEFGRSADDLVVDCRNP